MPPLSCSTVTATGAVKTPAGNESEMTTSDHIADPCDKVEDDCVKDVKASISDASSSTTTEKVPVKIVWRNVILFAYLHLASLYAIYRMFTSAKWQTNIFGEFLFII